MLKVIVPALIDEHNNSLNLTHAKDACTG